MSYGRRYYGTNAPQSTGPHPDPTADSIWNTIIDAKAKRAAAMPTEQDALQQMRDAYLRLEELGWRDIAYCPKEGTPFDSITAGLMGIADTVYLGEWPSGSWYVEDAGDLWPARPVLFRFKIGS